MTINIKQLGIITRFNGVDINQTRNYIKMNNATYIHKILEDKMLPSEPQYIHPFPINLDTTFNRLIEDAIPLTDPERDKIEK